jgi:hypothetical protein
MMMFLFGILCVVDRVFARSRGYTAMLGKGMEKGTENGVFAPSRGYNRNWKRHEKSLKKE